MISLVKKIYFWALSTSPRAQAFVDNNVSQHVSRAWDKLSQSKQKVVATSAYRTLSNTFGTQRLRRKIWAGIGIFFVANFGLLSTISPYSDFLGSSFFKQPLSNNVVIIKTTELDDIFDVASKISAFEPQSLTIVDKKQDLGMLRTNSLRLRTKQANTWIPYLVYTTNSNWGGVQAVGFDSKFQSLVVSPDGQDNTTIKSRPQTLESINLNYLIDISEVNSISTTDNFLSPETLKNKTVILTYPDEQQKYRVTSNYNHIATPSEIVALAYESISVGSTIFVQPVQSLIIIAILTLLIFHSFRVPLITFCMLFPLALIILGQTLRPYGLHVELSSAIAGILLISLFTGDQRRRENSYDSHLRNVRALSDVLNHFDGAIIAVKIRSFRPFTKGMTKQAKIELVKAIEKRLSLLSGSAEIYEIEPGMYVWTAHTFRRDSFFEQIEASKMITEAPIEIAGRRFQASVSFGIDLDSSETISNRIEDVNITVSEAEQNRLMWLVNDSAKTMAMQADLDLIPEILTAIERNEIYAVYQPKIDVSRNTIAGFEALARWNHPTRGFVSPEVFVRLAEDYGTIRDLTRHMMMSAMRVSKNLGLDVPISVNVQPMSLTSDKLIKDVRAVLEETEQPPHLLTLEITETNLMENDDTIMERMHALDSLGVGLSIDDFGSGYSTIDYIRKIPAKELKLDRQFIKDLDGNDRDANLLKTTIEMGHAVGLSVVVEGVEESEHVTLIQSMGADIIQGYYFSKPINDSDVLDFIDDFYPKKNVVNL